MDRIAGDLDEEVIMQIGHTDFRPRNAEWFAFATHKEIIETINRARIVVTQPAMSMVDALQQGTPVVVVPRLKTYSEVIDDHQVDLARELEKQGKVIAVYEIGKLAEALASVPLQVSGFEKDTRLVDALKSYINQLVPKK
jgi:UDP-N-acetylglucosamine transferase subunit ALG13